MMEKKSESEGWHLTPEEVDDLICDIWRSQFRDFEFEEIENYTESD